MTGDIRVIAFELRSRENTRAGAGLTLSGLGAGGMRAGLVGGLCSLILVSISFILRCRVWIVDFISCCSFWRVASFETGLCRSWMSYRLKVPEQTAYSSPALSKYSTISLLRSSR